VSRQHGEGKGYLDALMTLDLLAIEDASPFPSRAIRQRPASDKDMIELWALEVMVRCRPERLSDMVLSYLLIVRYRPIGL